MLESLRLQPRASASNQTRSAKARFSGLKLAIFVALSFAGCASAAQAPQAALPIVEVEPKGPRTYEIRGLAPQSWSSDKVRGMLLKRAAELASEQGESCFVLREAQMERDVAFVALPSGHMTVKTGEGSAEWQRYWRLYRQLLNGPGVRLIDEPDQKDGLTRVVEARMLIDLCTKGIAIGGGTRFEVSRILAKR